MKVTMDNRGATLVELLVAASIMVVVVFAVLAVIRVGSEIEVVDNHRRVARSHISSWFEENFTAEKYPIYEASTASTNGASVSLVDREEELDPRDGVPLNGTFTVSITSGSQTVSGAISSIDYVVAAATISWKEVGGKTETIAIDKRIADIGHEYEDEN